MQSIAIIFVVTFRVMAFPSERGDIIISNEFINSLRSQLTRDNYDYSGEDDDENTRDASPHLRASSKHEEPRKEKNTRDYKKITSHNFYIPTLTRDIKVNVKDIDLEKTQSKKLEHTVSNKDLLYYMDDRELVPEHKEQEVKHKVTLTTKYKILKLKHQYRRRNQPRLIQEESMGTVAIVNLDGGPVPEVRLPPSRRQYMLDRGEILGEEDEALPPVVNSSDPEAVPEDVFSKSNLTLAMEVMKE